MTAIESLIETISNHEKETFSKQHMIDLLKLTLPLEKLNTDMAELKGEVKANIKHLKTN